MKKYDALNKWLGSVHAKEVEEAKFYPAPPNEAGILYLANHGTLASHILKTEEDKKNARNHGQKFFTEIAGKLEVLAASMIPGLRVPPDMTSAIVDAALVYLNRAFDGDPRYLPYLNDEMPTMETGIFKCVKVELVMVISQEKGFKPRLTWYVTSDGMGVNPNDETMLTKVADIEKTYK
jgi:hypothetical protein